MLLKLIAQIGYTVLVILEMLLSLRFVLKFINVPAQAKLVVWLYSITDKILSPFMGIVTESVKLWGFTIDLTTLFAIFILSIFSYGLYEIIKANP